MTPLGGADNADWNHSRRTCGNVEHMGNRLPRIVRQFITVVTATVTIGACHASGTATSGGEPQLQLPASFTGALPCTGCAGVRAHLDLWPDGTFHLNRESEGAASRDDDLGRWRRDAGCPVILLYGGREMPLQFEVIGPRTLRALDLDGKPAGPGSTYDLSSDGHLEPARLQRPLHGMFTCLADAPRCEECLTGRTYPVAMEGDYLALERACLAAPNAIPGTPVMATFDGEITRRPPLQGDGTVPTVVVKRHVGLLPGQSCERAMSHASLSQQYWRVVSLRGTPAGPADGSREPHLILRGAAHGYRADAGCGPVDGRYQVEGTEILFKAPTAPAQCPATLRSQQVALLGALADARGWRIQGQALELFDGAGQSLALLEAVHLR